MRFVSLAAVLFASTPAFAQDAPAPTAAPTQPEKPVCRRVQVTGSNFPKRECHTKAEWAAIHKQDEENAEHALDNRRGGSTNSGM